MTLVVLLAGCSSGEESSGEPDTVATQEAAFVDAVQASVDVDVVDEDALKVGYLVCKELEAGRIAEAEASPWAVLNAPKTTISDEWSAVAGLNATTLCPDWYK